jgi:pilus assembly protein CpaF
MNTGHEGGCGTVHANSASDVPARLEALAALGRMGRDAVHAQMASAIDAVIHISRDDSGRRLVRDLHVLVRDASTGLVHTEQALSFPDRGFVARGPGGRQLERLLDRC